MICLFHVVNSDFYEDIVFW